MNGRDVYFTDQFISFNETNIGIYVFTNLHDDVAFGLNKKTLFAYYIDYFDITTLRNLIFDQH